MNRADIIRYARLVPLVTLCLGHYLISRLNKEQIYMHFRNTSTQVGSTERLEVGLGDKIDVTAGVYDPDGLESVMIYVNDQLVDEGYPEGSNAWIAKIKDQESTHLGEHEFKIVSKDTQGEQMEASASLVVLENSPPPPPKATGRRYVISR